MDVHLPILLIIYYKLYYSYFIYLCQVICYFPSRNKMTLFIQLGNFRCDVK